MDRRIISFSFLILALSIGYYFVIFLPQKEQEQSNLQSEKLKQEKAKEYASSVLLDDCLKEADTTYRKMWNSDCKELYGKEDCDSLPIIKANYNNNSFKELKDECFKKYPKN